MDATAFLAHIRSRGAEVFLDGDRVRCRAP